MDVSQFFGILAGLTAILAYAFYILQIRTGQTIPNPSSWAIWLLVGVINTFTYFQVVNENIFQGFIALAVTFSVAVIFIYSFLKGKFSPVSQIEIVCFILAVLVGVFWQYTADGRIANLFLQVIYVIAYVPTALGILAGTGKEHWRSWTTAVIAYSFSVASIALDYNGDFVSVLFPLVNGVLGNGFILALIFYKKSLAVSRTALARKQRLA